DSTACCAGACSEGAAAEVAGDEAAGEAAGVMAGADADLLVSQVTGLLSAGVVTGVVVAIGPVSVAICCLAHSCCFSTRPLSSCADSYAHRSRSALNSFLARDGLVCQSTSRSRKSISDCSAWKLNETEFFFISAIS